jgi:hypothetical protein
MHQPPPSGDADDRRVLQKMLGFYDGPAFMRRVKRVEEAERIVDAHLQKERDDKLWLVRLRVGQLRALAGAWDVLRPLLATDEALTQLRELHDTLRPTLRMPLAVTQSQRRLRMALAELVESMEAFNCRWQKIIAEADLTAVNELREGYNRHYLIEKECALGDSRVARLGFKRMDPLTRADVWARFPLLSVPRLAV